MHNRENVKVLLGYMQIFNCMGLPGKNCYNHECYFDPRERDITLFNTVLVYIEGFFGILWEVTRKQRFLGNNLRRNGFSWLKKKKKNSNMTVLLFGCETVSTHFSVFWTMSNAVERCFQLHKHICLEAVHALLFRHWTKIGFWSVSTAETSGK